MKTHRCRAAALSLRGEIMARFGPSINTHPTESLDPSRYYPNARNSHRWKGPTKYQSFRKQHFSNAIEDCVPQWLSGILNALMSLCAGYLDKSSERRLQ
jgi:hypothetical protein